MYTNAAIHAHSCPRYTRRGMQQGTEDSSTAHDKPSYRLNSMRPRVRAATSSSTLQLTAQLACCSTGHASAHPNDPTRRCCAPQPCLWSPVLQYRATDNGGPWEGGLLSGCHLLRADDYCCFLARLVRLGRGGGCCSCASSSRGTPRVEVEKVTVTSDRGGKEETAAEPSESERERRARQAKPGTRGGPGSEPGAAGSPATAGERPPPGATPPTSLPRESPDDPARGRGPVQGGGDLPGSPVLFINAPLVKTPPQGPRHHAGRAPHPSSGEALQRCLRGGRRFVGRRIESVGWEPANTASCQILKRDEQDVAWRR